MNTSDATEPSSVGKSHPGATQVNGALLTPADAGDATRGSPCSLLVRPSRPSPTPQWGQGWEHPQLFVREHWAPGWHSCPEAECPASHLIPTGLLLTSAKSRHLCLDDFYLPMFGLHALKTNALAAPAPQLYPLQNGRFLIPFPANSAGSGWKLALMLALASAKHIKRNRREPPAPGSAR